MQVAVPVWNHRISPVFESAGTLLVLRIRDGQPTMHTEVQLSELAPPLKVKWLVDHAIEVLICGAISRPFSDMIVAAGISLIPWVCGEIDDVVAAFLANALPRADLTMPGCCGRRLGAQHRGRGNGRGRRGRGHGHTNDP